MRAGKRIALGLAALLQALAVQADYKDSYSRGLEAAKDGDWAEVRQRMQEAIADNPQPAPRVRLYGQRWEAYVPQYYLGLAAFKQGDCATALAQWRSASNQGVIAGQPGLKAEQDKNSSTCDTRLAQQTPAKPEPTKPEPAKPEPVKPDPKPAVPTDPVVPKPDPKPVKPEPPKPEPPKPTPPKPAETPMAQRVPGPLLDAFRGYLAGRYAEVARINVDSYSDARARTQALLIRAASRQIQAELDASAELLESARADVRLLRSANPALVPDPTLFSPRFRSFYAATR